MRKIEQLINELCPNGVEYRELNQICKTITTGKLNANSMVENGMYPFYTCDAVPFRINEYAFDTEAILISGNGSRVGHINYYSGKFNAYQRTYVLSDFNNIEINFLLHYLKGYLRDYILIYSKKGSVPYITLPMLQNFKIPIPPLPIQHEIVRILNIFSKYTTELTTKLTEELIMRKKQYEYYRDSLLTFDDEVEWKYLGEIAHYSKDKINSCEIDEYSYVGVDNLLQNKQGITISNYVPKKGRLTKYETNNILIGNIRPYLRKIWFSNNFGGASGDVLIIQSHYNKILPKYLFVTLSSEDFFNYNIKNSKGTKMPRGNKDSIMKYKIPIPPLEVQQRIVDILDRFDILCNNISKGLPDEIEARKKQYEYYRDKLLTFKNINEMVTTN